MLNLTKMKAVWEVFQAGKSVADPKAWKMHQVSANAIAALLFAIVQLAKACGYDFGIDMQTCADIAIGILAIANVGLTVATTKHIGLPATTVREAEQTLPSPEQPAKEESAPVQVEDAPPVQRGSVHSSIDDDVRARAIQWAREHSATNGLANDA
jgi:hypothetical protein